MSKVLQKNLWWSFFITVISVIYAVVYTALPLAQHTMWCTYISVPLFFLYKGDSKEIPSIALNIILGFIWGLICMHFTNLTLHLGLYPAISIGVFISVMGACVVHMGVGVGTILEKCPVAFATFACCFANGGKHPEIVCGTMIFGLLLGISFLATEQWAKTIVGMEREE